MVIVHCFMQATRLGATHPRSFTIIYYRNSGTVRRSTEKMCLREVKFSRPHRSTMRAEKIAIGATV